VLKGVTQSETNQEAIQAEQVLPAALRLGPVHLIVTDLERSIDWYERALGLRLGGGTTDDTATLGGGGEPVLVLRADPDARRDGRHAGLYHYALLFGSREELARAAQRIAAARTPIQGASDHGTHEAIYLADPDGNGIELAADRPRDQWPADMYSHGPAPLDLDSLLSAVPPGPPPPHVGEGLKVGHMHLHVGDIEEGLRFYRDVLGFELQANLGSAAFVSAGGYHHHLGFNIWRGRGVGPAPPQTVGLDHWTVVLPSAADVAEVRARVEAAGVALEPVTGGFRTRDPWQMAVEIVADA
jgi:catechol 2,3-dioxygenase